VGLEHSCTGSQFRVPLTSWRFVLGFALCCVILCRQRPYDGLIMQGVQSYGKELIWKPGMEARARTVLEPMMIMVMITISAILSHTIMLVIRNALRSCN
jgi:hypothetical protein